VRFENAFEVHAPVEEVWATLLDVERVAPCMPGAEVLEQIGDDSFRVAIKIRVGPIAMTYRGDVEITERDDATHTATMRAKAREARGQGTADAHVHMSLTPLPGGTHATIDTEVALSGRVAAMGQGVIAEVSAKLVETFATNLAAMLAPAGDAPGATAAGVAAGDAALTDLGAASAAEPSAPGPQAPSGLRVQAPAAAAVPAPSPPRAAPVPHSTLPIGRIAAGVIAGRLANPRTLAIVALAYAIVFVAIGFLIGRVV
jgi:uncharacterized protein